MTITIPVWLLWGLAGLTVLLAGFVVGLIVGSGFEQEVFSKMSAGEFEDWQKQEAARRQAEMY